MSAATKALQPVPCEFRGVWQRTLLEGEGIETDTASLVFWLQTELWHGDLRIPPRRPDFTGCSDVISLSRSQGTWLASQKGFAGLTEIWTASGTPATSATIPAAPSATYCEWHRHIDFQPRGRQRDIGTMVFSKDRESIDEYGVEAAYHETWRRLPGSTAPTAAWQSVSETASPEVLLLIAGAYFFSMRDRRTALPAVLGEADLATILERTGNLGLLDMELSLGVWNAAGEYGTILHSNLPWREGQRVALDTSLRPYTVQQQP